MIFARCLRTRHPLEERIVNASAPIPLLSLDKTKQTEELAQMAEEAESLLMLKLDGLTVKLCYEDGHLVQASTRGDGDIGEDITHNIAAFCNVPASRTMTSTI